MSKIALLFDIDGTLLRARGLGTLAFRRALADVLKREFDLNGLDWLGQTDGNVIRQLLSQNGFSQNKIDDLLPLIFEAYTAHFQDIVRERPNEIFPFPHVKKLLDSLSSHALALVTGNLMKTAFIKLKATGLDQYFPRGIGGFGSDDSHRPNLVPIAIERMRAHYRRDFDKIVIIGDSHRDIQTARSAGTYAVAVATGHMDAASLASYCPDLLLDDFSSPELFHRFLKKIATE